MREVSENRRQNETGNRIGTLAICDNTRARVRESPFSSLCPIALMFFLYRKLSSCSFSFSPSLSSFLSFSFFFFFDSNIVRNFSLKFRELPFVEGSRAVPYCDRNNSLMRTYSRWRKLRARVSFPRLNVRGGNLRLFTRPRKRHVFALNVSHSPQVDVYSVFRFDTPQSILSSSFANGVSCSESMSKREKKKVREGNGRKLLSEVQQTKLHDVARSSVVISGSLSASSVKIGKLVEV